MGLKELTGESRETVLPGEGFGLEGYTLASLKRLFDQTRGLGLGLGTHQRVRRDCLPREGFGVEKYISESEFRPSEVFVFEGHADRSKKTVLQSEFEKR